VIEIVRGHIREGIRPIPIPFKEKKPIGLAWQKLVITEENVEQFFNGSPMNVGAILGAPSGNLQDVDIDCHEALALAAAWLPPTRTFGRASKPTSHYFYRAPDLTTEGTRQFQDPFTGSMLIELRSSSPTKGQQTVLPGSVHACGESIAWDNPEVPFTECSRAVLERTVAGIAAGCMLLRYWRPSAADVFVSTLRAAGWSDEKIEAFLTPIAGTVNLDAPSIDPAAWREALALPRLAECAEEKEKREWEKARSNFFSKMMAWLGFPTAPPQSRVSRPASSSNRRGDMFARASAYVDAMPEAISGSGGHVATFAVARKLVQDFQLNDSEAWTILVEYNARCKPPWSERELQHKLDNARGAHTSHPVEDRPPPEPTTGVYAKRERARVPEPEEEPIHEEPGAAPEPASAPPSQDPPTPASPGDPHRRVAPLLILDDGKPAKCAENVARLLLQHEDWNGGPRHDLFISKTSWPSPIPKPLKSIQRSTLELLDEDEAAVQGWLLEQPSNLRTKVGIDNVSIGIRLAARRNAVDSLQARVLALPKWDSVKRLDTWLVDLAGAEDTDVIRIFARRWMISAIARAMQPGCIADGAIVLEGDQGIGKNRLVSTIFGDSPWVQSVGCYRIGHDKEADRIACSSWVVHDDEMSMRRSDMDSLKAWISRREDPIRVPWDRNVVTLPRRSAVICSTNRGQYLEDEKNRRFWPVKCGKIDIEKAEKNRAQILAEALVAWQADETWTISPNDPIWGSADELQEDRKVRDPMEDDAQKKIQLFNLNETNISDLADKLGYMPAEKDRRLEMRLGSILRDLGYQRERRLENGRRLYIYKKK
jgi:Virulence-associated protein E/Bifunctional DNA primase/polymerase, N-terminal